MEQITPGTLADQIVDRQHGNAAAELGALGGRARAAKLSKEQRSEAARFAARKRWAKTDRRTEMYGLPCLILLERAGSGWRARLSLGPMDEQWADIAPCYGPTEAAATNAIRSVFAAKLAAQWSASVKTQHVAAQK